MASLIGKTKVLKGLNLAKLPNHIAIIMDGNGRWAQRRGLPRNLGHKAGCENIKRIMQCSVDLGIKYLTFFTFSTENWKRPQDEIDGIFNLVREYVKDAEQFVKNNIKVVTIGIVDKMPQDLVEELKKVKEQTKHCTGMVLNFAINYGGHDEILRAVNKAVQKGVQLQNEDEFSKLLDTKDLPNPDFVIRTSGEMRLSNFMLYQMAYSELYFTKTFWPSFSINEFQKSIINFQSRKRRFGGLNK